MGSKGTSVRLREKKLKTGRISLYLQFYNSDTNNRKKEYLGLYLIPKPKDQIEKDHNKEIRSLANSILSKVIIEIQEGRFGFRSKKFDDLLFLPYFESILESKSTPSSKSNVSNWSSTLSHLRRFTRDDLKLSEVDSNFLNDLKDYLLKENIGRGGRKLSQNSAQSYFKNVLTTLRQAFTDGLILDNPTRKVKSISNMIIKD